MLKVDNEFVELNKRLVYSIVNKYASNYNREDLFQVGMMAIMSASEMFDKDKGVKFSTFAYKHILGEILKYLREDKSIRVSRDTIRNYIKIMNLKDEIYLTYGRNASDEEISKLTGLSVDKIHYAIESCKNIESLDNVISDDGKEITLMDTVEDKSKMNKEDLIGLKDALSTLDSEERRFIYQRYYENKTQTEIAREKNINQVKVYRYERTILDKLKYGLE